MYTRSFLGRTAWESSYFGGVKRILVEYPFYHLNYALYAHFDQKSKVFKELTGYQSEKLVNVLFNQAFASSDYKNNFEKTLIDLYVNIVSDPELMQKHTVKNSYGKDKIKINVPESLLIQATVIASATELSAIYVEYGADIYDEKTEVYILFDIPDSPQGSPEGSPVNSKDCKDSYTEFAENVVNKFIKAFNDINKNVEDLKVSVYNVKKTESTKEISNDELIFAKKLDDLLDISYDPKPDVVKNLLQGKIDSEKLCEILSGNNRVYMKRVENETIKPFKVVVVGDYSGSMGNYQGGKLEFQNKVMTSLFYLFHDIMKIDDVEIYGHSGDSDPELYRFHSPEYPHFWDTISSNKIETSENYDGPIIEHIHKMVRAKTNKAVLLVSLSDGEPSGRNYGGKIAVENMKRIMEKLKRDNFVTVGIGMLYSGSKYIYQYSVDIKNLNDPSPVARIINRAVKENLVLDE